MYSTLEEIKDYFYRNSKNQRYIKRYFKLIEYFIEHKVSSEFEKHHILPRCLEKSKLTVKLPYKAHYLAHYMLAKIFGGKLWYAFNIMSRVIYTQNIKFSSILYEQKRKEVIKLLKEIEHSPMSEENKRKISERCKGKTLIKTEEGNIYIKSSEYNPKIHQVPWYGTKKSEEFKKKLSEKLKGSYKWITNGTEKIFLKIDEKIPEGFIEGYGINNDISEFLKNSRFVNKNGVDTRVLNTDLEKYINDGYTLGRINGPNWDYVNSKKQIFDILNWKYVLKDETKEIPFYFNSAGVTINKISLILFENKLFFGYENFSKFLNISQNSFQKIKEKYCYKVFNFENKEELYKIINEIEIIQKENI